MTKIQLRRAVILITGFYLSAFVLGLLLRILRNFSSTPYYETFKDLAPFLLAIPAAYLGYCFQRRSSFLTALRSLWSKMVVATNQAIQYSYKDMTSQDEYFEILVSLRVVVDEVRGVYKNVRERGTDYGVYPYEPVKCIHDEFSKLGFGVIDEDQRAQIRENIFGYWKSMRINFLAEFDRGEPSEIVIPYVEG